MNRPSKAGRQTGIWAVWAFCAAGALLPACAHAGLLYTDIPDVKLEIFDHSSGPETNSRDFDLNGDGTNDVSLIRRTDGWFHEWIFIFTDYSDANSLGTAALAGGGANGGPAKLNANDVIDGTRSFIGTRSGGYNLYSIGMTPSENAWGSSDFTEKFLGVRVEVNGQAHYGWIRVSLSEYLDITVHDYAFETTAGAPIVAGVVPEPSSLIAVGMGAAGLLLRRGRRHHA